MDSMDNDNKESKEQEVKKRRGIVFWFGRFFLILFSLFFALLLLIQLPFIQMWGIGKITKSISQSLNTRVTIGGFSLSPLSDLTLSNVYIGSPDHPTDTMINVADLQVDFQNLWGLFSNKLTINQVTFKDGLLRIQKNTGDTLTNLDLALLRLLPPRDTTKAPFGLNLDNVSASNLTVKVDDQTIGSSINMYFKRADVELDTLDITHKFIDIGDLDFDEPVFYITSKPVKDVIKSSAHPSVPWKIDADAIKWSNGKIFIDNENKQRDTSQNKSIDYAHLALTDVDISMDSLKVRGDHVKGKNIDMHISQANGLELETFSTSDADISSNGISLQDLVVKTPDSQIKNSFEMKYSGYSDFKSFADSVYLKIPAADIRLRINDLLSAVPSLRKLNFFADNAGKEIILQGNVEGNINSLKISNINASIGGISLSGNFRSHDLSIAGSQLLNLNLDHSQFSSASLQSLFPKMKIPPIMDKLGKINFTGKFDGYPNDFVAYGQFNTGLGGMTLNMSLDILNGLDQGKYSGAISLDNFDIGTLLNQPDIGRVSMTGRVIQGTGLTSETLTADLTAQMSSFTYKGYTYQNARLDGQISRKLFNGTLDINDPNVAMHFDGFVDFKGERPKLNFVTRIDSVRLYKLGLGDLPVSISGTFDVNLDAGNIDQFQGHLKGEKINATIKDTKFFIDSLSLIALIDSVSHDRFYKFNSDVASGTLSGVFDPRTLSNQLHQYLHEQYPSAIDAPDKITDSPFNQRLSWDIHIKDSRNWLDLAGLKGLVIKKTYTNGTINLQNKESSGYVELPELHYAGINVYASTFNFSEKKGRAELDMNVTAADLKENLFFEDILVSGYATDDSVKVRIKTDDIANIIHKLDIELAADPENGLWTFNITPIKLDLLGGNWTLPLNNLVQIKKGWFHVENFDLSSGERKIEVNDIDNKGIYASITGFDMNYLNSLWVNDKFHFSGDYHLEVQVDNIYKITQLKTSLHIPALTVNNHRYGEWTINAAMKDPKDSVKIDVAMDMNDHETYLTGTGAYLPPINTIPKESQNYLRLAFAGTQFPLDFIEFFLGGNVHDTEGSVDFTLNLEGKTNRLTPRGKGRVYNGSTTVNYLGTSYSFHDQPFEITESMIDVSGDKLYDVQGNSATIQGGLTHHNFKNFGLKATITSDRIIGLNVTSEENTNFYGKGIGSVIAVFSGTIANASMDVTLKTAKGTHIYIPLTGSALTSDKDFVVFLQNGMLPASHLNQFKLTGINLTMNMTITEDAEVEIIFDENTGEVLRGTGTGDLQLSMTRAGNLTMYGNYKITEGNYLFTNFKIIRKQFELLPGGEIHWDGDPYDAQINIRANYKGLKAAIKPLIEEYIVNNPSLVSQANERTDVDLTMILTGSLLHPNIAFDINFPTLTGEIKGYADSKIRALKANENAMLEQVVGLLITRSFLPTTSGVNTSTISKGIDNTLSELISTTLSSYLGGLLSNLIPQGQFLSGIDFEVSADVPITSGAPPTVENGEVKDPNASEYRASLPLEFFNDRLSVNVGGNYVTGSTYLAEGFGGDVTFEWRITPDGRLKIRAYNRNDVTVEGHKNKIGVGLAYRREYDSFPEIWNKKKKKQKAPETTNTGG